MKQLIAILALFVWALSGCAKTGLGEPTANPCDGVLCSGHGVCAPSSAGQAECVCAPGYQPVGFDCLASDPCEPNPCAEPHRGRCRGSGAAAICSCDEGYWDLGECVPAASCEPNPCTADHKGVCRLDGMDVVCACDEGYRDDGHGDCAVPDPCEPNPCAEPHRTRCRASGGVAVCTCDEGYWDLGECVPAASCDPNPCTGEHRTSCALEGAEAKCSCDPGYVDDGHGACAPDDPCEPSPCAEPHRTVCRASGGAAVCSCEEGYWDTGECVLAVSCSPNPCTAQHRTVCTVEGQSVSCACESGYVDDGADGCRVDDPCDPNPCQEPNRTVCQAAGATALCSCSPGYRDDGAGRCVPADPCAPNPCVEPHRSVCQAAGSVALCSCDSGYRDDGTGRCVPADPCSPNPCLGLHQSVCQASGSAATCSCDPGYRDDGAGHCAPADPCSPNPCAAPHRSICQAAGSVATCSCDAGYRDDGAGRCVLADPCTPNPCVELHRTVCQAAGAFAVCSCEAGWRDDGTGRCIPGDPCSPNPCNGLHRGVCRAAGSTALCSCDDGYRDDGKGNCVDACAPNPCTAPHQGLCTPASGGYKCGCDTGYVPAPGGGCAYVPPATCPRAHSSGDVYEPDECPDMARLVPLPLNPEAHTLDNVADEDWWAIDSQAGTMLQVMVNSSSSSVGLQVTVFDATGTNALATGSSSYAGSFTVSAIPGAARVLVRARAFDYYAPGSYSISIQAVADDYPNSANGAPSLTLGTSKAGALSYSGDLDWFSFAAVKDHCYRVSVTATNSAYCYLFDQAGVNGGASALASGYTYYAGTISFGFKAALTDTHYLRVQQYTSSITPTYSVLVEDLGLDDHSDLATAATPVTPGTPASGVLGASTDKDWFSFTALPGHIYEVRATGTGSTNLSLFASATSSSALATSYGSTATVTTKLSTPGPYYVRVQPDYSAAVITYTLQVTDRGPDDFGDTASEAALLTPGVKASGEVQYTSDVDFFSFPTVPGGVYRVDLASSVNLLVRLLMPNGTTELQYAYTGQSMTFGATDGGPYYLSVSSYYGPIGTFTLTVTQVGTDDHGNTATLATPLALGTAASGVLEYRGDQDWFAVSLTAQHVYRVDVVPSGFTARVQVLQGATSILSAATSGGPVQFRAASSGLHHLSVARDNSYDSGSAFTVLVTDLGVDDHGDAPTTATPMTLGASTVGSVQFSGDVDWLSLATSAGHVYRVSVTPMGFSAKVRLVGIDGVAEVATQSSYAPMAFVFQSSATGSYFVSVASQYTGGIGSNTVLAEDLGTDDAGNTLATAAPLVVGAGPVAGAIQYQYPADVDVYAFQAAAGSLTLDLTLQGALATSWKVTSPAGSTIASGAGPGTAALTLPSAGTWYVTVGAATAGQLGQYSVEIAP
ncbi:MAG: hypothetical protein QM765_34960 [Myxococcales bacterium]